MKTLKFQSSLVPSVASGEKTCTWRLFDDKDLRVGDEIDLYEHGCEVSFGRAVVTEVTCTSFAELTVNDKAGHETFAGDEEMYAVYSGYYKVMVTSATRLKVIRFKLVEKDRS